MIPSVKSYEPSSLQEQGLGGGRKDSPARCRARSRRGPGFQRSNDAKRSSRRCCAPVPHHRNGAPRALSQESCRPSLPASSAPSPSMPDLPGCCSSAKLVLCLAACDVLIYRPQARVCCFEALCFPRSGEMQDAGGGDENLECFAKKASRRVHGHTAASLHRRNSRAPSSSLLLKDKGLPFLLQT